MLLGCVHHLGVRIFRAALFTALLPALAACGTGPAVPSSHSSVLRGSTTYPLIQGKVAIYVQGMPTAIVANGRPVVVRLVLVNGLGHTATVPNACSGWLEVGLTPPGVPYPFFEPTILCPRSVIKIEPGITRVSRTVLTTYAECAQDPVPTDSAVPRCTGASHNQMPNLPPGRYQLAVETAGIPSAQVVRRADLRLIPH